MLDIQFRFDIILLKGDFAMSVEKTMLLEWLKEGVLSKIISERKAKQIYESKYAPVKNFGELLFSY